MLRTALVGSSGYIAEFIIKRFAIDQEINYVLKIDRNSESEAYLDLQKPEEFDYSLLDDVDCAVFTAAISGPDKCAEDFDDCWDINVVGTRHFISEALKRNCKILFFSSDAVFGDVPGSIFSEDSPTQPFTPYGRMKKAVEDEFKGNPLFKAIRLSYVVSAKDRFVSYCINCIKNGETADVFHPFYRNVISVSDVVDVVMFLIKNWDKYEPTFLNVAGRELVSRVRIAEELNKRLEGRLKYRVSMPDDKFFSNRPRITQMRSLYMQKYGIISDNTFSEKMEKELEDIIL